MIQSAMMFALGAFVTGLVALMLGVAFVRRTRRVTARQVLGRVATNRAEFETERDEMRVRHAVEMRRLEQELDRLVDRATVHRLQADLKDQDVAVVRADLNDRELELEDLLDRFAHLREAQVDLEARHAETVGELRIARAALDAETDRAIKLEDALFAAEGAIRERENDIAALRSEVEMLRAAIVQLRRAAQAAPFNDETVYELPETAWDRVLADGEAAPSFLPASPVSTDDSVVIERAAREVNRIAGEIGGDLARNVWRAHAVLGHGAEEARAGDGAAGSGDGATGGEEPRKPVPTLTVAGPARSEPKSAEARLSRAIAEIRSIKRAHTPGQ